MGLSERHRAFVEEYLVDQNATRAAIRAGYAERGAAVQGARLLRNDKVRAEIGRRAEERSRRLGLDADRVLGQMMRIAFHDMRDLVDEHGRLKAIGDLAREAEAGISFVELSAPEGGGAPRTLAVRRDVRERMRALEFLARYLGMAGMLPPATHAADSVAGRAVPRVVSSGQV